MKMCLKDFSLKRFFDFFHFNCGSSSDETSVLSLNCFVPITPDVTDLFATFLDVEWNGNEAVNFNSVLGWEEVVQNPVS